MLLPQARGEGMDVKGRVSIDALQHIDEVDIGIHALQPARRQQALDNPHSLGPHFGPTKQPVTTAQGDGTNLTLQMIGIERHVRILQKYPQGLRPAPGRSGPQE